MRVLARLYPFALVISGMVAVLFLLSCAGMPEEEMRPDVLISDLVILDRDFASKWSLAVNIQKGATQFSDRSYKIVELPAAYAGLDWIFSPADSKNYTGNPLVKFMVHATVTVFVAFDDRVNPRPEWLKGWEDTGDNIVNNEPAPTVSSLFKKVFPKESVVELGPNSQSAGCLQYMILIKGPARRQVASSVNLEWYTSKEAIAIGDNMLLFQRNTGGWPKDVDMAKPLSDREKFLLAREKAALDSTIDNNATLQQIQFLCRLYTVVKKDIYRDSAIKGLDYLLQAQYPNGGWPQVFPLIPKEGIYNNYITYNDNAMINVLNLFKSIIDGSPEYAFIDKARVERMKTAFRKGIECILKTQIRVNGKLTAWCAQHDPVTLEPRPARAYELVSISGSESVGVLEFLMNLENPGPEVIESIQSAVRWFDQVKLTGIRMVEKTGPEYPMGRDRMVEKDPAAPAIWARFYEIETFRPFFVGRDGIKKYSMAEIEHERRIGYAWYTPTPALIFQKLYPVWQPKYAPGANYLEK